MKKRNKDTPKPRFNIRDPFNRALVMYLEDCVCTAASELAKKTEALELAEAKIEAILEESRNLARFTKCVQEKEARSKATLEEKDLALRNAHLRIESLTNEAKDLHKRITEEAWNSGPGRRERDQARIAELEAALEVLSAEEDRVEGLREEVLAKELKEANERVERLEASLREALKQRDEFMKENTALRDELNLRKS